MLPQTVAGVDQRGNGCAQPVPLQRQLYVPSEADMPAPPQDGQQHRQARQHQRQIAHGAAAAGACAAAAQQRCDAHAGRRLQHPPGAQAAGQQRRGQQAGGGQPRPGPQPDQPPSEKGGEDRIGHQRKQRPQQPPQVQSIQRKLNRGKNTCVHQKIYGKKGFNGHLNAPRFPLPIIWKNFKVPSINCR